MVRNRSFWLLLGVVSIIGALMRSSRRVRSSTAKSLRMCQSGGKQSLKGFRIFLKEPTVQEGQ